MTTATELMPDDGVTLLDADLRNIMRIVDTYAAYTANYNRLGNTWGDEDGAKRHRQLAEEAIRAFANKIISKCQQPHPK